MRRCSGVDQDFKTGLTSGKDSPLSLNCNTQSKHRYTLVAHIYTKTSSANKICTLCKQLVFVEQLVELRSLIVRIGSNFKINTKVQIRIKYISIKKDITIVEACIAK